MILKQFKFALLLRPCITAPSSTSNISTSNSLLEEFSVHSSDFMNFIRDAANTLQPSLPPEPQPAIFVTTHPVLVHNSANGDSWLFPFIFPSRVTFLLRKRFDFHQNLSFMMCSVFIYSDPVTSLHLLKPLPKSVTFILIPGLFMGLVAKTRSTSFIWGLSFNEGKH